MAYTGTITHKANAGTTTADSITTASVSLAGTDTLVAVVVGRSAGAFTPTGVTDSAGGSWTKIGDFSGPNASPYITLGVHFLPKGSTTARTVTGAASGATNCIVQVISLSDLDEAQLSDFASNASNATPNTTTVAGAAILTYNARQTGSGITQPTGYTAIASNYAAGSGIAVRGAYDLASPGNQNWTTGNNNVSFAIEIFDDAGAPDQQITGSLHTDADTFFGATVSAGAVTISAARFDNQNTFYGATVSTGGGPTQTITASLFANTHTFHGASVSPGSVTITAGLHTDPDSFFGSSVTASYTVTGSQFSDDDAFFGASVSPGDVTITGQTFEDGDAFYPATVGLAAPLTITASRFDDPDVFFGAVVDAEAPDITPAAPGSAYAVDAEDRSFLIQQEDRTFRVSAEHRTFRIGPEDRTYRIPFEARSHSAPRENRAIVA